MPRRARYKTALLEELERQLAFAPPDAVRRQMEAAEALVPDIDPAAPYPFEFVVWRVTGYRPDDAEPRPIAGDVLREELSTFILHCSERVPVAAEARDGGAVTLTDLAAEAGVVEKTLRRWRSRGLIVHRLVFPDGRSRVGVYREAYRRFAAANPDLVRVAAEFTRMEPEVARAALAKVRSLVAAGATENLAAKKVAQDLGRSHEAIRQLLQRIGGGRVRPASTDRSFRERQLAYRAWRAGIPIERIGERLKVKADAIRRRVDTVRAERLRAARLTWTEFATFERPDADATILESPIVARGLATAFPAPEAIALLEALATERTPNAALLAEEELMLAAYNLLKRRARGAVEGLARQPDRATLDRIETDLRWALRVKRKLVERWLGVAIGRVQQALGGGLARRPADEIRRLVEESVRVVDDTIETVDPARRQVPRRVIAHDADLMVARHGLGSDGGGRRDRALARHERGSLPLPRLFERLAAWQELVDRPARTHATPLLARRYGWQGERPRTLEELAREERTTVARVTALVADDERRART
ncbi:MAG: hypothetical protein JNM94_02345 [Phycisphaerae bacterium]|nr:hypothetical protein [Phycisphaerae bacterium]